MWEMSKYILDRSEDKNPRAKGGKTPLHFAAQNGSLVIYLLIMDRVEDKNPKDDFGKTPLHTAVECGHFNACQFIFENAKHKHLSPMSISFFLCWQQLMRKKLNTHEFASRAQTKIKNYLN